MPQVISCILFIFDFTQNKKKSQDFWAYLKIISLIRRQGKLSTRPAAYVYWINIKMGKLLKNLNGCILRISIGHDPEHV